MMETETIAQRAASVARLSEILEILAREGRLSVRELSAHMGLCATGVRRYADLLYHSGLVAWGRRTPCDTERKLSLTASCRLCMIDVGRICVRVTDISSATGKSERQTVSLCDAIAADEALVAALHTILDARRAEPTVCAIGVCVQRGVALPPLGSLALEPTQIFEEEELTRVALEKEYATQSVLYIRYGEVPSLCLLSGGKPLPELRSQVTLREAWSENAATRIGLLADRIGEILSLLTPDVILLSCDEMRGDAVAESLGAALLDAGYPSAPSIRVLAKSPIESELLTRLYRRLAEQILREAKRE